MNVVRKELFRLNYGHLVSPTRSVGHWYKDWMPGPTPTTPAQMEAAAKKYNLLPEEYEPDPDYGDYPKLPMISGDSKDPYRNWDLPEHRKDHHETMHTMANMISEDRWDCNHVEKQQIHPLKQTMMYLGVLLAFWIPFWFAGRGDKSLSLPHMRKHLARDGPSYKYP